MKNSTKFVYGKYKKKIKLKQIIFLIRSENMKSKKRCDFVTSTTIDGCIELKSECANELLTSSHCCCWCQVSLNTNCGAMCSFDVIYILLININ